MKTASIKNIFEKNETVQLYFSYHAATHGEFYSIEVKDKNGQTKVVPYTSTSLDKTSTSRKPYDEVPIASLKSSELKRAKKHKPLMSGISMNPEATATYSQAKKIHSIKLK